MGYTERYSKSNDGTDMFCREWLPPDTPKAVIVLVHGMGEHSGRYGNLATGLNEAGYALTAFDLRGHGKSGGVRGDTPSYEALLDDLGVFHRETAARYSDHPLFLYGHSMGGNLSLNYVLRRSAAWRGVIVTSPWLRLAFEPSALEKVLARILKKLAPGFNKSSGLDTSALSRDASIVEGYKSDPLNHGRISVRLFCGIRDNGLWAIDHAEDFPLPLLLMHGTADRITSANASTEFAKRARGDITFRLWEGLYHELHQEPERGQIVRTIIEWLDARVTG